MEPLITPIGDEPKNRHVWITAAFVVTYLVFALLAIFGLVFVAKERDELKKTVEGLNAELSTRTSELLSGSGGKVNVAGDLNVQGTLGVDEDLNVKGTSTFDTKVTVGNPLIIKRAAATNDYMLQFKTADDINWSLGAGSSEGTDKKNLNLYIGAGLNDPIWNISPSGHWRINNIANSASAFVLQNAAKAELFRADTANSKIVVSGALETKSLSVGGGTTISKFISGTCSIDPPSVAAGDSEVAACSATGVATGDRVFLNPPIDLDEDLEWQIVGVNAANNIRIRFRNHTLVAEDDSSRTWTWFAIR